MATPESSSDPISLMAMWGSMKENFDPVSRERFSFEGPEKRLEIIMRETDMTHPDALRSLDDSVWEAVVGSLNAQIVSRIRNEHIQSYVLTESSLFVMRNRIILITCGTTTLLNSVPLILQAISDVRGECEWASFMHKNYSFPWEQKGPHLSMAEEYKTLKLHFPKGKPFIFGPVDSDHYFFYCYDDVVRPCPEKDNQMSLTMYGLDKTFTSNFFSEEFVSCGPETAKIREASHLNEIVTDAWEMHDLQFAPCGYSVNAIQGEEYSTMHITPEDHCSFASYETNSKMANLSVRMRTVLSVFKPQRFTVIVILDPQSEVARAYQDSEKIGVEPEYHPDYSLVNRTTNEFAPGYISMKLNYVLWSDPLAAEGNVAVPQKEAQQT
ncbi:S-adenosylmethionine decarboxylase, putative [Bodo saltans]|uniref:S-adenosylmethionine decarboxylase proenzyme n=1 Tax=Bodo saltans TaxID=75058 RepID=A0A0S4JHX8_BODSA|nr:S-adenosylmethionine decarboxylase, putative [Bodo saltans]|eukprot:CUG91117.1 S-adenosylmethionine decarboxylase, putative [Bodo saltans]